MSTCCFNLPFDSGSAWLSCVTWLRVVAFNIWDLRDNLGNEINSSEDAWLTANCAYLVVIVISVTRPDVLLSCEAAVGKQITYVHPTLMEPLWWVFMFVGCEQCEEQSYWSESDLFVRRCFRVETSCWVALMFLSYFIRILRFVLQFSQWRPFRSDHSAGAWVSGEQPPCVALSPSLTAPEDGKWCQSIHQSNTGGCAARRAGGVVMAACRRSAAHDYSSLLQLFPLTADAAVP